MEFNPITKIQKKILLKNMWIETSNQSIWLRYQK